MPEKFTYPYQLKNLFTNLVRNKANAQHRIGDSWAGRAFHHLFVRYWAVVPSNQF